MRRKTIVESLHDFYKMFLANFLSISPHTWPFGIFVFIYLFLFFVLVFVTNEFQLEEEHN